VFDESKIWGLWGERLKNMGSLGESGAERGGGLKTLTYASSPEWECPGGRYRRQHHA